MTNYSDDIIRNAFAHRRYMMEQWENEADLGEDLPWEYFHLIEFEEDTTTVVEWYLNWIENHKS